MTTFPPSTARPLGAPAAQARDWLKTLWPASYKGVPFKVEWDEEQGSRRIVEHEFPMRDDPFLEDLGEGVRRYKVDAYVASDTADGDAAAVIAICAQRGPGALVLPAHGPLIVRCLNFRRNRHKDKHGYIALELRFTREGAVSALASIASLANLIFVHADNIALSIATAFVTDLQISGQPNFVIDPTSSQAQDALSALEAIRSTSPVDATASATQRDAIQSAFDAVPTQIEDPTQIASIPNAIVTTARALGAAMPAASAVPAFEALATDPALAEPTYAAVVSVSYPTPSRQTQALNAAVVARTLRLAALTAYAEGIARLTLADRPSAITLRANVAEYLEAELDDLPASEIDLYHAIELLRDAVITYLSNAIINLAPIITVEANISLPSLFWAWRLYQDPARSAELVARNQVVHPSLMPLKFEALAR